jgi:hypothetical protein
VVFMTNRNAADGSWYDAVIAAAQRTTFDAPLAGSAGTPQFLADFTDPNFRSDLYMVDVTTHDLRELTHFTSDIIPEFNWNRDHTDLLWSAEVAGTGRFRTQVGAFAGVTSGDRTTPRQGAAAGLAGQPIDMSRVAGDLPPESRPATSSAAAPATSPSGGATSATPALPPVTLTYGTLWLAQLAQLGAAAASIFSHPPIS